MLVCVFSLKGSHLRGGEPRAAAAMVPGQPHGTENEASPEKMGMRDREEPCPESVVWG